MQANPFDPEPRPATDAEWQAALDADPSLRAIVLEVSDFSKAEHNPLLTEEGEHVLAQIRAPSPDFEPVPEKVDPAEDLSLRRNNPLLECDLDGNPGEPPEPPPVDPNDMSKAANNLLLDGDFEGGPNHE